MSDKLVNIAVSVGDLNGIGIKIALSEHKNIKKLCNPIYCINSKMLEQASKLTNIKIPKDFKTFDTVGNFKIKPAKVTKKSGLYSYKSFMDAINLVEKKEASAVVTLPINKESWSKASIKFKGHTDLLRDLYKKNAIMMMGTSKMYVALFTDHIPLKDVPSKIKKRKLTKFLVDFYKSVKKENIQVLALNPHASDNGVLGNEEIKITKAIKEANKQVKKEIFKGPQVPDTIFVKEKREKNNYYVAMYHDQGLIPLKTLYFDESINVSLNLPIIRTSVDHGTAFDIAYKDVKLNTKSYKNAIKEAIVFANKR